MLRVSAVCTFGRMGLVYPAGEAAGLRVVQAKGWSVYDDRGREYIDLHSGIAVNNVGHGHELVVDAVREQLARYWHVMVYGEYELDVQRKYAEYLVEQVPAQLNGVFFVTSGSEAVEGALKLARRATGRRQVVAFRNAYHGATAYGWSLLSQVEYRAAYGRLVDEVVLLDFNSLEGLEVVSRDTAAVIVEPVQGEAGAIPAHNEFLRALRERCSQVGALLVMDEVQTGFGRTGTLFAFEQYGVVPDVLVLGKALGGGLPLGALVASEELLKVVQEPPFGHITTFGGHALACVAGRAALEVIVGQRLWENARELERVAREVLSGYELSGRGAMLALHLDSENLVRSVVEKARQAGVLVDYFLWRRSAVRVYPPLVMPPAVFREALERLRAVVEAECQHS